MTKISIKNFKVAKRYANALYDSAKEAGITAEIFNDLTFVSDLINQNHELHDFLLNPLVGNNDKTETIKTIFGEKINLLCENFLYLLVEGGRIDALTDVKNDFENKYNSDLNIEKVTITSAIELSEENKERICRKLEQKLSAKVLPVYKTDSAVIGGLVIEARDKTADFSLKTKFKNLKKQLAKG